MICTPADSIFGNSTRLPLRTCSRSLDQVEVRHFPVTPILSTNTAGCGCIPTARPSTCTESIYNKAMPNSTAKERLEFRWYLTAALTEMWRAQRCAAAVLYYSYLGS